MATHLLEYVLVTPLLEKLAIELEGSAPDTDGNNVDRMDGSRDAAREELDRVIRTLPELKTLRIPA
jgi:hypothetical protein